MSKFSSLVHNENIKIYSRARTWIMLLLLAVFSILMPVLMYASSSVEGRPGMWDGFQITVSVIFYLNTIFTVVIASDAVAGEFSWGTIKLLLIRPWSRSKILLSKYISMVLFSVLTTVLLVVCAYAASLFLLPSGRDVFSRSGWSPEAYSAMFVLCRYAELFLTAALAFMVSSVFRASGLAIGLSLFIIFVKNIFITIFNPDRYEWANYLPFSHMDLSGYLVSGTGPGGATLGFSIAVLAAYYAVFLLLSWIVFSRRDVAG
ncbi:ABC transporter permease [Paenibacillus durus]|uniref:ABC transporter permease n=1 Tax=Paenibacillus durus ATCC 35681 TaxID=1333534 RepID=A0A0F7F6X0_PAEDU|nr:ABC transporter permease subunit [Paenibacillus durus]AKG33523.1 ABC transporter permease [Paenibacillus durus ATCC 35681]